MKVGILTFHCAHNYGAVLQCYALQEYLRSLGHSVCVIDYRPKYLTEYYKKHKLKHWIPSKNIKILVKSVIKECIRFPFRNKRYNAFQKFINNKLQLFPLSESGDFSRFDAVILGSDQIWNAKITGRAFDPLFFGEGVKCKKIVYAASNKNISLSSEEKEFYTKALKRLDYIGVRETTLQGLLQPLTNKRVVLNLDPTLLAGDKLFKNLDISDGIKKKYVFIYEITPHKIVYDIAKQYAKTHQYKVIELGATLQPTRLFERDQTASPEEWVRYIKHAEFVFTTSFHGVAFSILLKKQFCYIRQNNPSDYRIESLLKQLNIMDRIIDRSLPENLSSINFNNVENKLVDLRKGSEQYLQEALG